MFDIAHFCFPMCKSKGLWIKGLPLSIMLVLVLALFIALANYEFVPNEFRQTRLDKSVR